MTSTHLTHWGAFRAETDGVRLTDVRPHEGDTEPNELIHNVASAQHHATRIDQPYVREGWLRDGPGAAPRGDDRFVPVSWERALDLLSGELRRVYAEHGGQAVYGGSYGWGSAGRFHHAQSQVHRFLKVTGGYVRSVGSYSYGAAETLLPHVIGSFGIVLSQATSWESIAEHTELMVAFGGVSAKNSMMSSGGVVRHQLRSRLDAARKGGTRFVSVSPLQDDTPGDAEWLAPHPGTDAALMLALAHVLIAEDLVDHEFVGKYCAGYDEFAADVVSAGRTPEWASGITGVPAERIVALAREMAASRTLITVSWSLQRARHGEQPLWLGIVLAAMLGQIGLPGGGFGHGYGSTAYVGERSSASPLPGLPQGLNPVSDYIPVARIADMLLNPGQPYDFNGQRLSYPDIRLVYWCGGNPFHHHQDLARLREAFSRPETVVVHDPFWTSTARHADIVLPSTMTMERDDFGMGNADAKLFAMPALTRPHEQARDDYTIFAQLAERLGVGEEFTEGRDARGWLEHMYGPWAERLGLPGFADFWAAGSVELPAKPRDQVLLADFRAGAPLATPSGRIEIHSARIASFGYADCPGHPTWLEPEPRTAEYPLCLLANQPKTRLHSQLDVGDYSRSEKVRDREPLRMHPADAATRGLAEGDIVRVISARGSCLAAVRLSADLAPGVVQLSTGAWYDPDPADPRFCRHGNPNVLTSDVPASTLTQSCAAAHVFVEVEPFTDPLPALAVLAPPPLAFP